jgi:hypothetical protein
VRVEARVADLERDFDAVVAASESANLDDEHDPEGSTVGFEELSVRTRRGHSPTGRRRTRCRRDLRRLRAVRESDRRRPPAGVAHDQVCVDCAARS